MENQEQKNLPSIQQLYDDSIEIDKQNNLNLLLNQPPKESWIIKHPIAKKEIISASGQKIKVPIDYLTIQRIEFLLTSVFKRWKVEIKEVKLIANSVSVTIRLHYMDIISGSWDWQDGIGAAPLQTSKDAGAIEFDKIKTDAVMKAAPAAESYAIKDAAEKLGKLFGKDLNRADKIMYDSLAKQAIDWDSIKLEIKAFTNEQELQDWAMEHELVMDEMFSKLVSDQLKMLNN